ncbi:hypothetical protein TIFTF001_023710 [Ficus carica]|uniref:Uncharacterized protein n=1 Tax=Ficus carica TaxID=3494 RepID=A0AA88AV55_FICCA|nr:hypothetical protein TIFTF001_023710 [Ficus carica]
MDENRRRCRDVRSRRQLAEEGTRAQKREASVGSSSHGCREELASIQGEAHRKDGNRQERKMAHGRIDVNRQDGTQ